MTTNRTDIPSPKAPNYHQRVRETLMTYLGKQGNPLDRGLTLRDLIENGIVKLGAAWRPGSGVPSLDPGDAVSQNEEPDLTPPPTPTGFTVSAAISHVFIEHDAPVYPQGRGHLQTRVYGATVQDGDPLPVFADAVEITQFTGMVHAHPSNPSTTWRLWIKWETIDGVLSANPAGGTNGLEAVTGQDVSSMVLAMTGAGNPFTILPADTIIDGVTYLAGTYSVRSFIIDGQITNAKIANATINSAKIANLSASKLIAGSIAVGEYIQSAGYVAGSAGWRINGNGDAELSNAIVRGTVFASDGTFTGTIQAGTTILGGSATAYASGDGFFGGVDSSTYKWRVGIPGGARIQWTGSAIEVYNASNVLTLSSGSVNWAAITGQPSGIYNSNISIGSNGALSGGGGGQVSLSGLGAGAFALINAITSGNIGTYIESAAIGRAYIADAAINNAKIENGAITTAKIADAQITSAKIADAQITAAKIADAQITNAKIGALAVDTLKIAGNSVTVQATASGSGYATFTISAPYGGTILFLIYVAGSSYNYSTLYLNGVPYLNVQGQQILDGYSWAGEGGTDVPIYSDAEFTRMYVVSVGAGTWTCQLYSGSSTPCILAGLLTQR